MNLAGASQIHVAPYQGTDPHGMILAGTVAKGVDVGCTSCPMHAGGNDDVFTVDGTAATVEQNVRLGGRLRPPYIYALIFIFERGL